MRSVENQLYRAFNPSCELFASGTLNCTVNDRSDGLTNAERIADDSRIRLLLENELNDHNYRILRLFFTESNDIENTRLIIDPIRPLLISTAKISASSVSQLFVDLCAISEFWNTNLLKRNSEHGGLGNYGNIFTNCSRRKRIKGVIQRWRLDALAKAKVVIEKAYMSENDNDVSATA